MKKVKPDTDYRIIRTQGMILISLHFEHQNLFIVLLISSIVQEVTLFELCALPNILSINPNIPNTLETPLKQNYSYECIQEIEDA